MPPYERGITAGPSTLALASCLFGETKTVRFVSYGKELLVKITGITHTDNPLEFNLHGTYYDAETDVTYRLAEGSFYNIETCTGHLVMRSTLVP